MTVLEVIQRSSDFLSRKGIDSPRLQIELLLAHVLQMPRMKLYLNFDRMLTGPQLDTLRALVKRRSDREPLQHLVGSTNFCGLEMIVTPNVLIPRPETELLAEQAIQFLSSGGVPSPAGQAPSTGSGQAPALRPVLDFGTGSGCLAIVIAARCPDVIVHALDRSGPALEVARQNAAGHGVADRVRFHHGDGLAALELASGSAPGQGEFVLLVSNPPYISTGEIAELPREVRDFDPREALDGGEDGLAFYRILAADAGAWLKTDAPMMLELGAGQAGPVTDLLRAAGWQIDRVEADYGGHERILIAHRVV